MAIFHQLRTWGQTEINPANLRNAVPSFFVIFVLSLSLGILFTLVLNFETILDFSTQKNNRFEKEKIIERLKQFEKTGISQVNPN